VKHARGITRWMIVTPGFDCRNPKCERPNAGDHGICGEQWTYAVSDGDQQRALTLVVYTNRYPATVTHAADWPKEGARGAYLDLHAREPWYEGQEQREGCTWLGGAPCYSDGTCLGAEEFFKAHGDPSGPNQSEKFWIAMEVEFARRSTSSPPLRAPAQA
jgi:hypothetical protein